MSVPDNVIWPLEILAVRYIYPEHILQHYPAKIIVRYKNPRTYIIDGIGIMKGDF